MAAVLEVVCSFLAKAAIVGIVIGIFTRCSNIFIRAFSGKEDIL